MLNKAIDAQKDKIATLSRHYVMPQKVLERTIAEPRTGLSSNNAKAELNGMERELEETAEDADNLGEELEESGKSADDAGGKFEKFGGILKGIGVPWVQWQLPLVLLL